jgi:threonine synthase
VAATAHPAKFVDTVEEVLRKAEPDYSLPVPPQLAGIRDRETRCLQWSRPAAGWGDVWTRDLRSLVTQAYESL